MKRFLVFLFDDYYPEGGWHDFAGSFDTIEEARHRAAISRSDRFQIVDLTTGEVVDHH